MDKIERRRRTHADNQATLHNIHFETKGLPWEANDFLVPGHRQKRKKQVMADAMTTRRMISKARKKAREDELPVWARELSQNRKQRVN